MKKFLAVLALSALCGCSGLKVSWDTDTTLPSGKQVQSEGQADVEKK